MNWNSFVSVTITTCAVIAAAVSVGRFADVIYARDEAIAARAERCIADSQRELVSRIKDYIDRRFDECLVPTKCGCEPCECCAAGAVLREMQ